MDFILDQIADETIELLEARLRRIEYVVTGAQVIGGVKDDARPAIKRLEDLERSLNQLVIKSRVMQDLLKIHTRHPELFHNLEPGELPSTLDTAAKLSIVLAAASSFPLTASRLTSIHDTPLPPTESSAQIIEIQSQAALVEKLQDSQLREIADLKQRSAAVLQRWYAVDILRTGECWADLETRIERVDRGVRQAELVKQQD